MKALIRKTLAHRLLLVLGLLVLGPGLQGCVAAAVGGVATTARTVAQERSVGDAMDDLGTKINIQRRMIAESSTLYMKTDVSVVEGRVLLTGIVPDQDTRIQATKLAWQAPNVKEVLNELEVADKSNLAALPQDTWITTRLRARLIGDGSVKGVNYSIETNDRTVFLMGIAQSQSELDRVLEQARSVKGVRNVISYVKLKDDPTRGTTRYSSLRPDQATYPEDATGAIEAPPPHMATDSSSSPAHYGAYAEDAPAAVGAPQGYTDLSAKYDRPATGTPTELRPLPPISSPPQDVETLKAPPVR